MRKIKVVPLFTVLAIVLAGYFLFANPYQKIRDFNEDFGIEAITYLRIYKVVMPRPQFDTLITKLIRDNMDIPSINLTAEFLKQERLFEYLKLLREKCDYFKSYPRDTSWVVQITPHFGRESAVSELGLSNSFCNVMSEMSHVKNLIKK